MNEKKMYVCEYCNEIYSHKSNALECEKNHKKPVRIEASMYHARIEDSTGYPAIVVVKMTDGSLMKYRRC